MKQRTVLVIGAGASGLVAAITAARQGAAVTLLDRMKKPGRKLLITGNGKCNLSNLDPELSARCGSSGPIEIVSIPSGKPASPAGELFRSFGPKETISFFEELGVAVRAQELLVYPRSGQAQSVLNALTAELDRLHVKARYNTEVTALTRSAESGQWTAKTEGWSYQADCVILCCGSKAAPQTGSDGSGYALAAMAGHTIVPVLPALTGLICELPPLTAGAESEETLSLSLAAGARSKAKLSLSLDGHLLAEESGELQWTDYGVSGIAAFQLSRFAAKALLQHPTALTKDKKGAVHFQLPMTLSIDLVPDQTETEVRAALQRMIDHSGGTLPRKQLLGSYVHERVAALLASSLSSEGAGGPDLASLLAANLKKVVLNVSGLRGFDQAQICIGGVRLAELDPLRLESRLAPGLFFAGEMIDVDGPCGGYNLQWAWTSGHTAGLAAASRI